MADLIITEEDMEGRMISDLVRTDTARYRDIFQDYKNLNSDGHPEYRIPSWNAVDSLRDVLACKINDLLMQDPDPSLLFAERDKLRRIVPPVYEPSEYGGYQYPQYIARLCYEIDGWCRLFHARISCWRHPKRLRGFHPMPLEQKILKIVNRQRKGIMEAKLRRLLEAEGLLERELTVSRTLDQMVGTRQIMAIQRGKNGFRKFYPFVRRD